MKRPEPIENFVKLQIIQKKELTSKEEIKEVIPQYKSMLSKEVNN
jgi:hypothetical protein